MYFAVNYSPEAVQLLESGKVRYDFVKLPAWPKLIKQVLGKHPCFVHFPLKVGGGNGVLNNETKKLVNWNTVEKWKTRTNTPFINLHVGLSTKQYPKIPQNSTTPEHFNQILDNTCRDVCEAIQHFGKDKIIIENEHDGKGSHLTINILPELYHKIIAETGCGFLLDVSHARIAARALGFDEKDYIQSLPIQHIREIHLTGIQWFGEEYIQKARAGGLSEKRIGRISHTWMDHLPLTDNDWPIIHWATDNIQTGHWSKPWGVSLEYGGLGKFFGTFTDSEVLLEQIPKLYKFIAKEPRPPQPRHHSTKWNTSP